MLLIARVHAENCGVYGTRKVWLARGREGVARHGRAVDEAMGLQGFAVAAGGGRRSVTLWGSNSRPSSSSSSSSSAMRRSGIH